LVSKMSVSSKIPIWIIVPVFAVRGGKFGATYLTLAYNVYYFC
jgi:hypothetical protein